MNWIVIAGILTCGVGGIATVRSLMNHDSKARTPGLLSGFGVILLGSGVILEHFVTSGSTLPVLPGILGMVVILWGGILGGRKKMAQERPIELKLDKEGKSGGENENAQNNPARP